MNFSDCLKKEIEKNKAASKKPFNLAFLNYGNKKVLQYPKIKRK